MRVRRPRVMASGRPTVPVRRAALAAGLLALTAGCGSSGSSHPALAGSPTESTPCGTTRTAANVPVNIQVARGQVPCSTALKVERAYARQVAAGKAPGNGGGGPIRVLGWTCEGFPTPVVLKTGQASKCVEGGVEILAILPAPA